MLAPSGYQALTQYSGFSYTIPLLTVIQCTYLKAIGKDMKFLNTISGCIDTACCSGIIVCLSICSPVTWAQSNTPSSHTRAVPVAAKKHVETVPYQELLKVHFEYQEDGSRVYGKAVQVAVNGTDPRIGYFAKREDATTFVCLSGDKKLVANKSFKGIIQGVILGNDSYEGATVFQLKNCQIIK